MSAWLSLSDVSPDRLDAEARSVGSSGTIDHPQGSWPDRGGDG